MLYKVSRTLKLWTEASTDACKIAGNKQQKQNKAKIVLKSDFCEFSKKHFSSAINLTCVREREMYQKANFRNFPSLLQP